MIPGSSQPSGTTATQSLPKPTSDAAVADRGAAAIVSGALTTAVGAAGIAVGIAALGGSTAVGHVDWLFPLVGVDWRLTGLGGFFALLTGAVALAAGCYTVGYARAERIGRFPLAMLPLFAAALVAVPLAGSVPTFLLAWELMAATSTVLVLADHRRAAVRVAGLQYAVLTHLSYAAILVGLLLLAAVAKTADLGALTGAAASLPAGTRTVVFLACLIGFGTKAGLVPLHAWLPRAHPEAPSPVSALMSAAMVAMGCYGVLLVAVGILGPGPRWWGLLVLLVGIGSAVFGVLHASVTSDLKRLLAYSTTENMGLVMIAVGAAMVLAGSDRPDIAAIAITAALIHLCTHAAFKTLAFLAAGSVLVATGLRDLDRLGGLARPMPATTIGFGIAGLGAAGLPVGAGFVSEWLLLQSLIHYPRGADTVMALVIPLAMGAVALAIGLGVMTMVKAFGVGFLARARSPEAMRAREAPPTMLAGMGIAALACLILGLAPGLLNPAVRAAAADLPFAAVPIGAAMLRLPEGLGSIAPGLLALALVVAIALATVLVRRPTQSRPVERALWACGADTLSPRMQYTATSYAQPLQRVFDPILQPETELRVGTAPQSRYVIQQASYRSRAQDAIERRMYLPVVQGVRTLSSWVRRAHTGSVQLYLAMGGAGLLATLLITR